MPEETGVIIKPDTEPFPFFVPMNKHEAGLRISKIARIGRRRPKIEARYDRTIAKATKRLDALKAEKNARLIALNEDANLPANELVEYMKQSWAKITDHGSVKLVSFFSGSIVLRNLPDRAVVTDADAFIEEARRMGKARVLIARGKEKPNLDALNKDLLLAAAFKTVTIERRSSVTIRPKFGSGLLRTYIPRKMSGTLQIRELLGDQALEWKIEAPGDDE